MSITIACRQNARQREIVFLKLVAMVSILYGLNGASFLNSCYHGMQK